MLRLYEKLMVLSESINVCLRPCMYRAGYCSAQLRNTILRSSLRQMSEAGPNSIVSHLTSQVPLVFPDTIVQTNIHKLHRRLVRLKRQLSSCGWMRSFLFL